MNGYDLQYTDVIYHFDRIRCISTYTPELLSNKVQVNDLVDNARSGDNIFHHNWKKTTDGKDNWYKSKIDSDCCNDEFMKIIDTCSVVKISKIEIAKDLIFNNFTDAYTYEQWFLNNVEKKYNRKRWCNKGILYLGKSSKDDDTKNYFRAYVDNSKVTGEPCFHSEFVIEGCDIIKKRIRNKYGVTKLTDAMDLYYLLEKRYLKYSMSMGVSAVWNQTT